MLDQPFRLAALATGAELPALQQPLPVAIQRIGERLDTTAQRRTGRKRRRLPALGIRAPAQGSFQLRQRLARRHADIFLIDDDHMRHFHDARLEKLNTVAGGRLGDEAGGVGHLGHVDFLLPHTDRLDQHDIKGRQHRQAHRPDLGAQAAKLAATGQRADEHLTVGATGVHAQPVTEQRAATDRAGRIDRQDRHLQAAPPPHLNQRSGQR